ncbi:MAG: tetratricopeptide repeat protein [Betaproteobacteria bacterium]
MMFRRRRAAGPAGGWSNDRPSPAACVSALVGSIALFLFLAAAPPARAQAPRRATPTIETVTRAYIEGRYDDVARVADQLDAHDPRVVALKARAMAARGRYSQAEELLRPAAARAPASDAALELGLLEQELGRPGATATLQPVAEAVVSAERPQDLARAARALRALGRAKEANAAYRDAAAAAPDDAAINAAWGDLFLENHQTTEAAKSFQIALHADPKWEPALLGLAESFADDNPPQSIELARSALALNPSDVAAQVFIASQAIDAGRNAEAREALGKALAVNPSSLDAHAWLAAIAYVEDREADFDAEVAKVQAIAPSDSKVYRIAGELAAHNYRFDEAVALTRRALALDPHDPRALADLGLHLLRTGDEPGARTALETSFKLDPYSVVTYNLLQMLDTLDRFVTVRDGDLILRMDPDEAPVLREYALQVAHKALGDLGKRYEFTPRGPILIEIFPKQDDFAVRNVGLPGMIGALGACFGRVVTLDSPKAVPPGTFQWEAALWHELAHVITLQMSNQRVPRWLTEGISVFEQKRARPEWARNQEVEFAGLLNAGGVMKLADLNAGFTDPHKISIAYYEASLLVEHLVATYGDAGLRKLLRAYGEGLDTDTALKTALDTSLSELQTGFDQSLERRFGPLRRALDGPDSGTLRGLRPDALQAYAAEHPRSYPVQMALGSALGRRGDRDGAMKAFERAAALVPSAIGDDSPHAQMAALALEAKDSARAIQELRALVAVDFDNVKAARQLASLLQQAGVTDEAKLTPVYQRIAAVDPFDAGAHRMIGRSALAGGNPDEAAREFRAVLALKPVDAAEAHTDLAESYFKSGRRADAKKETLAALEIAPTYQRAQELLLKLVGDQP